MRTSFVSAGAVAVALLGTLATCAAAAPINVTTTADEFNTNPAACSLREAVQAANSDAAFGGCSAGIVGDTVLVPGGTYRLTIPGLDDSNAMGDLDITTASVQIVHSDSSAATIDANGQERAVHVVNSAAFGAISGFTITGGLGTNSNGGGISTSAPTLLRNDTVVGNAVTGSGLGGRGGGIFSCCAGDPTLLENVTISDNKAGSDGGGYYNCCGRNDQMNNVTISGNTADADNASGGDGGGIYSCCGASVTLQNTLIAGNTDASTSGTVAPDCFPLVPSGGSLPSSGFNLIGDPANCSFAPTTGDLVGQDARLGPVADNGGPVLTAALLAGSPAIDAGSPDAATSCAARDARGIQRPQGPRCDIGAFELQPSPAAPAATCKGMTVTITGTAGADKIRGTKKADVIAALAGNDTVTGLKGNDIACGGGGKDRLKGGPGNDKLFGEGGKDKLSGGGGKDKLSGGGGRDKLVGGAGRDSCNGGAKKDTASSCENKAGFP